jgi:Rrf2 family protein
MRLSFGSAYALRALVHLMSGKENAPVPSRVIAAVQGLPERFLGKVLKPLVTARILHSLKGPNGGYRLARPADRISLLDVIEAVDGPLRGRAPLDPLEGGAAPCNGLLGDLLEGCQPLGGKRRLNAGCGPSRAA